MTILTESALLQEDNVPAVIGALLAEMSASPVEYPVELMTEAFEAGMIFLAAGGNSLADAQAVTEAILSEGIAERFAGAMGTAKEKGAAMLAAAAARAKEAKSRAGDHLAVAKTALARHREEVAQKRATDAGSGHATYWDTNTGNVTSDQHYDKYGKPVPNPRGHVPLKRPTW